MAVETNSKWAEAQRAVIGSLMIDSACAGLVFQKAAASMFNIAELKHIFEASQELWNAGRPIDPVTVQARAGDDYKPLIAACMNMTPTAANVGAYIDILRTEARLSALQVTAMEIVSAKNEADAAESYEKIGRLLQATEDIEDFSLTEMISAYLDRMNDPTPPDYLRFGIEKLDEALAITPGMFVIIGADSSTGKTALALQFAVSIAQSGKRVGFFSLETPTEPLQNRIMAELQVAKIPVPVSQKKKLSDEDFAMAAEAAIKSEHVPLRFIRKATTLEQIRSRTMQRRFEVIFIDYVQLIDVQGKERWDVVTRISMGLHRMAQELGVTIVGLSQITPPEKGKKKNRITVDDLRESRQLKQDADIVLLMTKSDGEKDPPELRVLEVAKNKDGRRPKIKLNFDPEHMTFTHYKDMNDIRADGQVIRNKMPTKAKEEMKAAPQIPTGGKMVEMKDDGEELPF